MQSYDGVAEELNSSHTHLLIKARNCTFFSASKNSSIPSKRPSPYYPKYCMLAKDKMCATMKTSDMKIYVSSPPHISIENQDLICFIAESKLSDFYLLRLACKHVRCSKTNCQ